METSALKSHGSLYASSTLCLLLIIFLNACNGSTNTVPTHHSQAFGCTPVAASPGARGGDAAILATIPLPGQPFRAVGTNDGQWIFVSFDGSDASSSGIAVLHKTGVRVCLMHVIHLDGSPLGIEMTKDNRLLLVADYKDVALLDVSKAETGAAGAVLGYLPEGGNASTIEVAFSPDERYAFASNENLNTVSMFDFQRVRTRDFGPDTLIGQIPTGQAPVGLVVSPDNRYLYITSESDKSIAASASGLSCTYTGLPTGSLRVADLTRARSNPARGIVAQVKAGCDPVRVILSATGDIAWVTARESNIILAFHTKKLLTNPAQALINAVGTPGAGPVGLVLVKHGTELIVADSARFSQPNSPQTLGVLDVKQALQGQSTVLAEIHVGAFPRELSLEADGQMLLLTNYNSDTINIIDVTKLP